jgi:hypothetical protein
MTTEKPGHIVEQDPLEGGGFMYWVAGIFLAIAVGGFAWTSQLTAPTAGVNYQALFNVTFLLDAPPKDADMP